MKDELSIFTKSPIPKQKQYSEIGFLLTTVYLFFCLFAVLSAFNSERVFYDRNSELLWLLTLPTSLIGFLFFRRISNEFEDTDIFFVTSASGLPTLTWRSILFFCFIFTIGIVINSYLLYLIGEKLQRLFGKTK